MAHLRGLSVGSPREGEFCVGTSQGHIYSAGMLFRSAQLFAKPSRQDSLRVTRPVQSRRRGSSVGALSRAPSGRHMQGTLRAAMGFTETSRRLQRHHTQGSTNMNLQTCNLDTCGTQNAMQMDTQIAARTQNREDLFMLTKDTHTHENRHRTPRYVCSQVPYVP